MLSEARRAAVTARLRRGRSARAPRHITRRPADIADLPASFGQEQLWFLDRLAPGRSTYNVPCAVRLRGPLDPQALSRALDGLVARHEALRTRLLPGEHGRPVQVIDPPRRGVLQYAAPAGPGQAWPRLRQLAADELRRPFSLAEGPLLRAHLVPLAEGDHMLLVMIHHAVFDGWSTGVLVGDLAALYQAEATGAAAALDELPVQFADYAVWERQRVQGPARAELEAYWRQVMGGAATVRVPADRPRPSVAAFHGAEERRGLAPELLEGLRELSQAQGTTLFVTLMAAFQALLHRYTGQADIVVGTTSANRRRAALAPLIGFLVNTLPVRADLSGDPPFTELIGRVGEATVGAYAHQDLPFTMLVEALGVPRNASHAPVLQHMFNLIDKQDGSISAAGVTFELADNLVPASESKFDISLFAHISDKEFGLAAIYASALFDAATVQRLLGNFEVLLAGVVADPSARLSRLPVLTGAELHQELEQWNDTDTAFPAGCLHEGFAAQAARTPDAVAAQFGTDRLSYAELDRQANQVARRLRAAGVGPEVLVGVSLPASLRRLAALLGVLRAGGAYVPLDPGLPPRRLEFMAADAGLAVVLASRDAALPPSGAVILPLDTEWPAISALDDSALGEVAVRPSNAAYVIYTSGSTGQPKGVVVEHRQAVNFVRGMIATWRIGAADAVLQFASLSFDVSVMDMFMPLLAGGRVVLVPPETLHSPPRLAALIRAAAVTYACLTPSVLGLLADEDFPALRSLASGGEELTAELARAWQRPGLALYNTYGPTEAAVVTTHIRLDDDAAVPPPLGRPLPNYQAYVLDADLNPVPAGVIGELHIGGAGVARGYLRRPGLTAERFIPDPFRPRPGGRLYKSGDLVRRRPDGTIAFVGRADFQVKIRGLRIELGEIEAVLAGHPDIAQALVTVVTGPAGEKQLAAYLCPQADLDLAELRGYLARTLPAYMIPAHLITVDSFPLNASGKTDRAALPPPGYAPDAASAGARPATVTETIVADLYATILRRPHVSADDRFFDIGGSSLQVMRLIDLISRQTGADISVTAVFLHPTPRQLAASIDAISSGTSGPAGREPVVELSAGAGQLPLFLIHAVGGTVFAYTQLAGELAETFKVYGIQAPALAGAEATAASLDDLVADYTERIRAAQPDGPYRLAGWSMGGVVAFEIARRLERSGAEVALLALLDAPFTLPAAGAHEQTELAGRFVADAAQSLGWDAASLPAAGSPAAHQLAWLSERLAEGDREPSSAGGLVSTVGAVSTAGPVSTAGTASTAGPTGSAVAERLRQRFEVFQAHARMLAGYQAAAPVAVTAPALIVSADGSPNAPARAHWPTVLGGPVSTLPVDSDHYTFLRPPLVTAVAASIRTMRAG
jgi:amino acid adenylation domain-containing protein